MLPSFKDIKVPEQIIEALKNMGITKPMPVQAQAIPCLLYTSPSPRDA